MQGTVEGDGELVVSNVSKIEEGKPGTLAFLANPKYEHYIYTTKASVVLVNRDFKPSQPVGCTLVRVASAYDAIAALLRMYEEMVKPKHAGIEHEQPSFIAEGAQLGEGVYVGAFAYIGKGAKIGNHVQIFPQAYIGEGVSIGDNTVINAGVKIYYGCVVGHDCTIHAGTVIGADGFGFAPSGENYEKVAQIGNVVIEDYVEIGANACIDRAGEAGQPGADSTQCGGRREHGDGGTGRSCRDDEGGGALHVRRPGRDCRAPAYRGPHGTGSADGGDERHRSQVDVYGRPGVRRGKVPEMLCVVPQAA